MIATRPKVTLTQKADLLEKGVWPDFLSYFETMRAGGAKPGEARKMALAKFLGSAAVEAVKVAAGAESPLDAARKVFGHENPSASKPDVVYASKVEFDGKKPASEVESIRWVADSICILDVTPADCPSRAAWNMLQACRRCPDFEADFWKSIYTKILPSRGLVDDGGDKDDIAELASMTGVIDRLLQARDAARKAKETKA